jgi:hypothetical protein
MPEPRSYVVGLPVVVTVHDDGTVKYWVDTSETSVAMFEDDGRTDLPSDEQMQIDSAIIDRDHDRLVAEGHFG